MQETKVCTNRNCIHKLGSQPLSNFYKDNSKATGLSQWCKDCVRASHQTRTKKKRKGVYAKRMQGTLQDESRRAVHRAVQMGFITIPSNCEFCDQAGTDADPLQAHHTHGYELKHWFDIQWVHRLCHDFLDHSPQK